MDVGIMSLVEAFKDEGPDVQEFKWKPAKEPQDED